MNSAFDKMFWISSINQSKEIALTYVAGFTLSLFLSLPFVVLYKVFCCIYDVKWENLTFQYLVQINIFQIIFFHYTPKLYNYSDHVTY